MPRAVEVLTNLSPRAVPNYVRAFDQGDELLQQAGLTTPLRFSHFLAQVMHETGGGQVLRENMDYRPDRIIVIFGVGHHSAAIQQAELTGLAHNPEALAERVYGLGNPVKAREQGARFGRLPL